MNRQSDKSPDPDRADTGVMWNPAIAWILEHNGDTHNSTPTRFVEADGIRYAYRRFGNPTGTPIVLLQHFMGNLDNYDPAITDALAQGREVILTDNAGVGLSTGTAPQTVGGMARQCLLTHRRSRP
jgi:hypothetical protein